jgi:hypothetical protein
MTLNTRIQKLVDDQIDSEDEVGEDGDVYISEEDEDIDDDDIDDDSDRSVQEISEDEDDAEDETTLTLEFENGRSDRSKILKGSGFRNGNYVNNLTFDPVNPDEVFYVDI